MTIDQLRKQLEHLSAQGHANKQIAFGPEKGKGTFAVGGGIMMSDGLLLSEIKLDKVGGF